MNVLAQIEALKKEAALLTTQLAETEQRSSKSQKTLRRAKLRLHYFQFAKALRAPAKDYSLWVPGVLIVGSAIAAAFAFVVLFLVGLSSAFIAIGMLTATLAMLAFLAKAVSQPATAELPSRITQQQSIIELHQQDLAHLKATVEKLRQQIGSDTAKIKELSDSDRCKREQLLKRNWKTMQGTDWQEYLIEVFEVLGASAQLARTSGDEGVDLIVRFGEMMIAVQTKGYVGSVDKEAVQQVVAGKVHYGCDRAAVITNSRFTAPARSLAMSNSCFLIGEQEFPAFVMGSNLEMFQ